MNAGKHAAWGEIHIVRVGSGGKFVEHWVNIDPAFPPMEGIFRLKDGKVSQNRVVFEALALMQQIGVAPAPDH